MKRFRKMLKWTTVAILVFVLLFPSSAYGYGGTVEQDDILSISDTPGIDGKLLSGTNLPEGSISTRALAYRRYLEVLESLETQIKQYNWMSFGHDNESFGVKIAAPGSNIPCALFDVTGDGIEELFVMYADARNRSNTILSVYHYDDRSGAEVSILEVKGLNANAGGGCSCLIATTDDGNLVIHENIRDDYEKIRYTKYSYIDGALAPVMSLYEYYHPSEDYSQYIDEYRLNDVTEITKDDFIRREEELLKSIDYILQYAFVRREALVSLIPSKSCLAVSYYTMHETLENSQRAVFYDRKYRPYRLIALRAESNNCYVSCDLGKKIGGKYERFNEAVLSMSATAIGSYEQFELIPCSDGYYAIRSVANRQYLSCDFDNSYFYSDFVVDKCKVALNPDSRYTTIKFKDSNIFLVREDGQLKPKKVSGYGIGKIEQFEIVYLDEGEYRDEDISILASGQWFNIDGTGKGFWDIQNDIGEGKVDALQTIGYAPMHVKGSAGQTVENGNMQSAVGVREQNGIYDVVITFQGTMGYAGDSGNFWNFIGDIGANLDNSISRSRNFLLHDGYYDMAKKFDVLAEFITARVDGREISLRWLIDQAKYGRARITLLGHSMGGAIAQIYSLMLINKGVSRAMIRGRTFNSALAIASEGDENIIPDWYNLCVSTDSVTNGLVMNSLCYFGIHRIGKTIWLYDDEPDKNGITGFTEKTSNISYAKHNMDKKLKEILNAFSLGGGTYIASPVNNSELTFVTNRENVPLFSRPGKDSDKRGAVLKKYSVLAVDGYIYNEYGNLWYKLEGGDYVYSGNVSCITKLQPGFGINQRIECLVSDAPVRAGFGKDAEVLYRLRRGQVVNPLYAVKNAEGNVWYYIEGGWVYSGNLGIRSKYGSELRRIRVDCPVDVELYDSDNTLVASITHDGEMYSSDSDIAVPYMVGNIKFFDIANDAEFRVKINAVSYGEMDYVVYGNYDEEAGDFSKGMTFSDVMLEDEKQFEGDVPRSIEKVTLGVLDSEGRIVEELQGELGNPDREQEEDGGDFDKRVGILIVLGIVGTAVLLSLAVILIDRKKKRSREAKKADGPQIDMYR